MLGAPKGTTSLGVCFCGMFPAKNKTSTESGAGMVAWRHKHHHANLAGCNNVLAGRSRRQNKHANNRSTACTLQLRGAGTHGAELHGAHLDLSAGPRPQLLCCHHHINEAAITIRTFQFRTMLDDDQTTSTSALPSLRPCCGSPTSIWRILGTH